MAKKVQLKNKKRVEAIVLNLPPLVGAMAERSFELKAAADANLEAVRSLGIDAEGKSSVERYRLTKLIWRVELVDPIDLTVNLKDRGSAAQNIEQGRGDYVRRDTGEVYGGMDGKWIIRNAIRIVRNRRRRELRRG